MGTFLGLLALAAGFAAVVVVLVLLGGRVRRRGAGMVIMNQVDEIFRPATHHYRAEIQIQDQRVLRMPSADDKHG